LVWHDHYGQSEALDHRPYKVLRQCSRFFAAICCVNDKLRYWCQTHLHTKTIIYVPNFSIAEVDEEPLLNLKGTDGKRLLCVANLRPQKDHVSLINAFKEVQKSHPEWTLHCVGHDFGDSYARTIKRLVKDLNLESKVFFYGSRTDVHAFMHTCDIGVLSSRSEGLPLVLLEYGQAAMPVVATAVGDCAKVIKDEVTGLMLPSEAAEALAKALEQLMTDPLLRHNLGEALKAHVEESFGVAQALKVLSLVYHQAMERN
jgi:glycosyltransferase involved in cell wall biosynthesis